jgi:hypothetical protein
MKRGLSKILSILLLALVSVLYMVDWANANISSIEREALIALFNNTNGENWTNKGEWNGPAGTECTWYGITCDQSNTTVQMIDMSNNNLIGTIPAELGNLKNLLSLSLWDNQLSGTIPDELGNLTNLQYLAFGSNQLTGKIPISLMDLPNLSTLFIWYNGLHTDDDALLVFLNTKDPDWESTQTVAPEDVTVGSVSVNSVLVQWTPVAYTADPGSYKIYYSTTSGGPYTIFDTTVDKSSSKIKVTGLDAGSSYYFIVQAKTDPHLYNQNTVYSDYSEEVSAITAFDEDSDGIDDEWETTYFLDTTRDGTGDFDSDGLTDLEEYENGLDPTKTDTDGDGIIDYDEVKGKLNTGWNLKSMYKEPEVTDISTVLGSISDKVISVWAYVNGQWQVYDPANPGFSDLTVMEAGKGYWINMREDAILNISGSVPSNPIAISIGWNLVGYNSGTVQDIAEALTSIEGQYISVWAYIDGQWQVYDPANPGFSDLLLMEPGYGYWINSNQDCMWALP